MIEELHNSIDMYFCLFFLNKKENYFRWGKGGNS